MLPTGMFRPKRVGVRERERDCGLVGFQCGVLSGFPAQ